MKRQLYVFYILLALANSLPAQTPGARFKMFNLDGGLALEGYDPVAYLFQKKAVEGKSNLSFTQEGVTYYFSTQQNLDVFKKNPAQFEPMYGGWCAYAMGSTGEKVEVDPETFKIINGRLFLFYNQYFNNTLTKWNKEEAILITKADINWKRIISKNPNE